MFKLSDMTHSSKMGWNTIRKLSGNPTESKQATNGNPNQIVHQLRQNGKTQEKRLPGD